MEKRERSHHNEKNVDNCRHSNADLRIKNIGRALARQKGFTLAEVLITLVIIGIIAAITVPTIMQNVKKKEVETKLKQAYSIISQLVKRAEVDHGQIQNWNFDSTTEKFVKTYFLPYLSAELKASNLSNNVTDNFITTSINGIQWRIGTTKSSNNQNYYMTYIYVDINGEKQPNKMGRDQFNFYIVRDKANIYNLGSGNIMKNISQPGIYYDGYGHSENHLLTDTYRGCNSTNTTQKYNGAFCTALIANNGFKIPDNYPYKL